MKFVSWNVNGLRACVQKGFLDFFNSANADFFCLQETKLQPGQIELDLPGYQQYWCYAEKKGYSGTAIFTKHTPQTVHYGIDVPELDTEGRVITLEYPEFYLVTCYTPNAQRGLARIEHRLKWEESFRKYLLELDSKKCVVICGDLNVALQDIDLKNPAANRENAGFSDQERHAFATLLGSGFTDTFRYLNPNATGCYTWWSYMFNARQNNAGWRIDYFLVSDRLQNAVYRALIHSDILGSDHCPVELDLEISCNGGIWQSAPEGQATQVKPEKPSMSQSQKRVVQSGIAAGLLAVGFVGGFFTNKLISSQENNALLNYHGHPISGITAKIAQNLTTDELIHYVVQIPELLSYYSSVSYTALKQSDYETIRNNYPVLAELETRSDAGKKMRMSLFLFSSATDKTKVISLLLTLDVYQLDEETLTPTEETDLKIEASYEILYSDDNFTCYAYTDRLEDRYYSESPLSSTLWLMYSDGIHDYKLNQHPTWLSGTDQRNIWLRIEPTEQGKEKYPDMSKLSILIYGQNVSETEIDKINLGIVGYNGNEGAFVVGYAFVPVEIQVCYQNETISNLFSVTADPFLNSANAEEYQTEVLANYVLKNEKMWQDENFVSNGVWDDYPIMGIFLNRGDAADTLFEMLNTGEYDESRILQLLARIPKAMTQEQQEAILLLSNVAFFTVPVTEEVTEANDCFVIGEDSFPLGPEAPGFKASLPLGTPNCYTQIILSDYAKSIYFSGWDLKFIRIGDSQDCILTVREYYDENGNVAGWFLYGYTLKSTNVCLLLQTGDLTLQQQTITLQKTIG